MVSLGRDSRQAHPHLPAHPMAHPKGTGETEERQASGAGRWDFHYYLTTKGE